MWEQLPIIANVWVFQHSLFIPFILPKLLEVSWATGLDFFPAETLTDIMWSNLFKITLCTSGRFGKSPSRTPEFLSGALRDILPVWSNSGSFWRKGFETWAAMNAFLNVDWPWLVLLLSMVLKPCKEGYALESPVYSSSKLHCNSSLDVTGENVAKARMVKQ